jgi:hypothetical protein
MLFDTTASNTGRKIGACKLLEQKMDCELLHLACRHHIHEIVLEKVFAVCLGPSTGPEILLFKRFQKKWASIKTGADDYVTLASSNDLVSFCNEQLQQTQPRDDYRELLELSIIILGETPGRGVRFIAPGALHRARWMARVIYSMEIWMFRLQFRLTPREEKGIRRLVIFSLVVYLKAWFQAPLASSAPNNDLAFFRNIVAFEAIDEPVSKAAGTAFSRYL